MKEAKKRTIYNNYDLGELFDYIKENPEEFFDDNEDCHSDNEIWDEVYQEDETTWNIEKEMMEDFFTKPYGYIIYGSVGRWDGIYDGGKIFKDWDDLWSRPNPFKDCEYFHFYDENGHFYVNCSHHDGNCSFEIRELTKRGKDFYENWEYSSDNRTERDVHNRIIKDSHYSRLPRYAEKIYGCPAREFI